MSERFVKVNDVETVESSNSTALIVLFVTVIAVVVIGLMFWQPWAAAQPQSSTTTIIHEGQTPAPNNQPIIVNPPANSAAPGNTKIDIHNDIPKQDAAKTSAASNNDAGNDDAKNAANN